jgi:hypothetical protein
MLASQNLIQYEESRLNLDCGWLVIFKFHIFLPNNMNDKNRGHIVIPKYQGNLVPGVWQALA